jgi:hypothetical protein
VVLGEEAPTASLLRHAGRATSRPCFDAEATFRLSIDARHNVDRGSDGFFFVASCKPPRLTRHARGHTEAKCANYWKILKGDKTAAVAV